MIQLNEFTQINGKDEFTQDTYTHYELKHPAVGKAIRIQQVRGTGMYEIVFTAADKGTAGGQLPQEFQGKFTSIYPALLAVNAYIDKRSQDGKSDKPKAAN